MVTSELVDVAAVLGSIVGVWFAVVGWKLLPQGQLHPPTGPGTAK
ncbi:MAG TPA: hypothetical protein VLM40_21740 [Gemmata sp.]|nr:hypothetical protein [Gemmata sp.]